MIRFATLLTLIATLAAGCATTGDDATTTDSSMSADDPIRTAVFTYLFANNNSGLQSAAAAYFLELRGEDEAKRGTDPSRAVLDAFRDSTPPVRPASLARHGDPQTEDGVFDPTTGKGALLFFVGPIERTSAGRAKVYAGHYEASLGASGGTYWLEEKDGRWQVVKVTDLEIS